MKNEEIVALLPHQEIGSKLLFNGGEKSVLIADEPRVGKTFTAIELENLWRQECRRRLDKTLIICGKDILSVWRNGLIARGIRPDTIAVIDHPKRKAFTEAVANNTHDYYIINYDSVAKVKELGSGSFLCIIIDEAHNIKGRDTKRTKAAKRLKTEYKIATTGTPADNKIEDMWSILNWLWKKDFGSYWRFVRDFTEHWTNDAKGYTVITGVNKSALPKYWEMLTEARYLRRTLSEVSGGMPPILYTRVDINITGDQRKRYLEYERTNLTELKEFQDVDTSIDLLSAYTVKTFQHLQIMSTGLTSVSEHDVQKWDAENKRWYWDIAQKLHIEKSPKVDWILERLREDEFKYVILCQHNDTAAYIARQLNDRYSYVLHSGLQKGEEREQAKALFQSGEIRLFIGTFGVSREGIDLSMADRIIMVDRPWRTKWNEQAENRVRNLAKNTPVEVIDLVGVVEGAEHEGIDNYRLSSLDTKSENISLLTERPD